MTCIYLSVKIYEDDYAMSDMSVEDETLMAERLTSELDVPYSVQELNRMERSLLGVLDWDLMLPTCDRFMEAMLLVIGAPHLMASPLLVAHWRSVVARSQLVSEFLPSILALSLLSLMLQATSADWSRITRSLKNIFKVSL